MSWGYQSWQPRPSVAQQRAQATKMIAKLTKAGVPLQPVAIAGTAIARSFWGKGWCRHLETYADLDNRLPRGRSYVRTGAVIHLEIAPGRIAARVLGSELYEVTAAIAALKPKTWKAIKHQCVGGIGSLLELLQGRLSEPVMRVVTDPGSGLFPHLPEISFTCSCPDWAGLCKHVAAVLYGVGNRLDNQPELLFRLRGVDPAELIEAGLSAPRGAPGTVEEDLAADQLGAIFGVEFDADTAPAAPAAPARPKATPRTPSARNVAAATRAPAKALTMESAAARTKLAPTAAGEFHATGAAVAALRQQLGLSQSEFAARLAVAAATVQRWEASGAAPLTLRARCLAALRKLHRRTARQGRAANRR